MPEITRGTKLTYMIWLEHSGGRAFGEGPYRLLKGVELTGSLRAAASGIGMAYSKARRVIAGCERSLGFPLALRKIGGGTGGGSVVTLKAAELMKAYETLRAEAEEAVGEAYKKHFGQSIPVEFYTMITHKRGARKPAEQRGTYPSTE
jgi:molybdate transport system regulatory protein